MNESTKTRERNLEKFYFTFGTSEAFPLQSCYIIIEAHSLREAIAEFRTHYPDRTSGVVNCAFFYSEAEWARVDQKVKNFYGDPAVIYSAA